MNPRFLILFLLLLTPAAAHAIGFANPPAQREIIFSPGLHKEIPIFVTNGEKIKVMLQTQVEQHPETLGTPQDDNILSYVRIEDRAPDTGPREVMVVFDLPQQMRPGTYTADIYAADYGNTAEAMITAVAMVKLRFTIRVLSPDKFAEIIGLSVPPTPEGMDANATVVVVSRTTQELSDVQATISVYKDGQLLTSSKTESVRLASSESKALSAVLDTETIKGGEYEVNATVTYDGKEASAGPVTLKIGTLHVGVPEHTQTLVFNTTNKFLFNVSNQWNRELQEVYEQVGIGAQVKKTASQNIPPFGKTQYEVYFDRDEALAPGSATVTVNVTFKDYDPIEKRYNAKQETFQLPVQVIVPEVPKKSMDLKAMVPYAIIGLLALLLIIALILLFRRQRPAAAPPQAAPAPPQAPKV